MPGEGTLAHAALQRLAWVVALGKKVEKGIRRPPEAQPMRGLLVLRVGATGGGCFPFCATARAVRRLARRVWKAEELLGREETPEGLTYCTTSAQTLPAFLKVLLGQRN